MSHTRVQDLSLYRNPEGFRGRSALVVQLWWLVQATLFALSPQFMYGWRRWLLRLFGAEIGRNVLIRPGVRFVYPWKVKIGDYTWIGNGSKIYSLAPITIGAHVAIAEDVHLISGAHRFRQVDFAIFAEPIVVEDECWLCNNVFVHQGVHLGRGSVLGACSVVRRDTAAYSINVGSPAREVGYRLAQVDVGETR